MDVMIGIVASIVLLIVTVWLVVFGGTGALIGPYRGRTRITGFLAGALFGPLGCAWILARDRAPTHHSPATRAGFEQVPGEHLRSPTRSQESLVAGRSTVEPSGRAVRRR